MSLFTTLTSGAGLGDGCFATDGTTVTFGCGTAFVILGLDFFLTSTTTNAIIPPSRTAPPTDSNMIAVFDREAFFLTL